jgi:hypothetical protein
MSPTDRSINRLTVAIWVVGLALIANLLLSLFPLIFPQYYLSRFAESSFSSDPVEHSYPESFNRIIEPEVQFYDLPLEEQIAKASVIAVARYEAAPDGRMRAIISEILKKESGTVFYYKVGDEHPSSSYFPRENERHGEGLVIFFEGSPATIRLSMSFDGDRIRSLGDLPLELLRNKCLDQENA